MTELKVRLIADWRKPDIVLLRDPGQLYSDAQLTTGLWRSLGFRAKPDADHLMDEFRAFRGLVEKCGVTVADIESPPGLTADAVFVRDTIVPAPGGLIACNLAKANRVAETESICRFLTDRGIPVNFAIRPPGTLEGGDVIWLRDDLCVVGRSYRSNAEGISQLRSIISPWATCHVVSLPHFRGPESVLHLGSLISVLSNRFCLVDKSYLPADFLEFLISLGFDLIEMPEEERNGLACNVLSLGERLLIVAGCPKTASLLRASGFVVDAFVGDNLCLLGDGGPTCLTRSIYMPA